MRDDTQTWDRKLFVMGLAAFGILGGLWGVWAVLLTDLSRVLDISAGSLGLALSGGVVASIPAMFLGGRAADRWGRRAPLVISGASMGISFAGLAFTDGYALFVVVLIFWCATSGVYDVVINAFAMDLELTTGRRVLAPLHAAFSGGGAIGAFTSGILIAAGLDHRYIYVGALLPVALVTVVVGLSRFPHAAYPPKAEGKVPAKLGLPLVLVGVVTALAFFSEGTMEDWSGVYLRQTLALPALVGASGVAVYHAAMAVGRLCTARAIKSFGNRRTLLGAGFLVAGGMAFALSTREPVPIIAGFLVVGLALSAVAPIAFSVAGAIAPDRAGGASSVVATLGYCGLLAGPAAVGGIAEFSSLQTSLWTVALAGLLIVILAGRLKEGEKLPKEGTLLEVAPVPSLPVPDFWFRARSNGSVSGEYGRLHLALRRAHRPIPPPSDTRPGGHAHLDLQRPEDEATRRVWQGQADRVRWRMVISGADVKIGSRE